MAPRASAPDTDRGDPEAVTWAGADSDRLLHRRKGAAGQDPAREERGIEAGEVARVRDDPAGRPRDYGVGPVHVVVRIALRNFRYQGRGVVVAEVGQESRLRELRRVEPERFEDALLELAGIRAPGDLLDDEAERDVVRVRVAPLSAGIEDEWLRAREAQEVDRPGRRRPARAL